MKIRFGQSRQSTIGIEWELALVDTDSGDLRQVAQTVLDAVALADGSGPVSAELDAQMDGHSLLGHLRGKATAPPRRATEGRTGTTTRARPPR